MAEEYEIQRGRRLKRARIKSGFKGPGDVIKRFKSKGVKSSYYQHENGSVGYSFKYAQLYGKLLSVRPEWLYSGEGPMMEPGSGIAIKGRVAAGNAEFENLAPMGGGDDYLPLPDPDECIALKVEGDSMLPLARDGDYALFGPQHTDPSPLINHRVMAQLKDGRTLFKILRRGTGPGLYTLNSLNDAHEPIEDVELEWALPLEWLHVR